MKKLLNLMICFALLASMEAGASEKKHMPSTKEVENILKEIGGEHYVDRMKIYKIGSFETKDSYIHAFNAVLKNSGFRIIFMDNNGNYIGYYASPIEPINYDNHAVLLDSGGSDAAGNPIYESLPVGEDGLADKVRIAGTPISLVRAQAKEEKPATAENATPVIAPEEAASQGPEYREWTITRGGKTFTVRAVFEKEAAGHVYIKSEVNGVTVPVSLYELSNQDKDYVKQLTK